MNVEPLGDWHTALQPRQAAADVMLFTFAVVPILATHALLDVKFSDVTYLIRYVT